MDYFQGVVTDFLRANRATFVNAECCIQLQPGANPDTSGPHWYCDALTVNLPRQRAYLCEVSYAQKLSALRGRLAAWREHWPAVRQALARDSGIPLSWTVRPWVFIPSELRDALRVEKAAVGDRDGSYSMPAPRVTYLEDVMPWKYVSWNRVEGDDED